jgi:molybdopterin molybdotransferase
MIPFEEALNLILAHSNPLPKVRVPFERSLGNALAQPLKANTDSPLFDQSAVDGFAVRVSDVEGASEVSPVILGLAGVVRAGSPAHPKHQPGSVIKIFTGGRLPIGAEAVVMKEVCAEERGKVQIQKPVGQGENIRWRGEEYRKGDLVLPAGTRITPPVISLLATFDATTIQVYRQPKVTLLVTGDELASPGEKLRAGQIRDSNSYALTAALQDLGIEAVKVHRVKDERKPLENRLRRALVESDVVITVGGVSVGEYDLVKEVLGTLGVEAVYWRVAIKPGMPNYFGTWGLGKTPKAIVFGLPGNPVAALLSLHKLIQPSLMRLMGHATQDRVRLPATLLKEVRKKPGRMEWLRGVLSRDSSDQLVVTPTAGQGSHMVGGLAEANCLIEFPLESSQLEVGQQVKVELLSWRG